MGYDGCPIENIPTYTLGQYITPLKCSPKEENCIILCEHLVGAHKTPRSFGDEANYPQYQRT